MSRHLLANFAGRSWAFLSTFLFVPAYVKILGIDNFGVIALFLAVAGIIAFLDLGLSPTLAIELHNQRRDTQQRANLLFTYEVAYAAIVGTVLLCVTIAPAGIFSLILSSEDLARPAVGASIRLVFIAAAVQMLLNFYVAGLMGVEEQVKGNVVIVVAGIVRSVLVLVPLWLYPQPMIYLIWQIVFVLFFSAIARYLLYKSIERGAACGGRVFEWRLLVENLSFMSSMFLVSVTAAVNTQVDKLFVGRLYGLGTLAEYSLVATFAQLLVFVISPVTITLLPRFVRSVSLGEMASVRALFLVAHKIVAAILCAAVGCMVFFGPYLISIWTVGEVKSEVIAAYTAPLVVGYALLALGTVPHCVAVANKNLKGGLVIGFSVIFTMPAYWILINRLGALGGAITWLALQAVVVPLYTLWVNRRFIGLPSLGRGVLVPTLVVPLLASLALNFIASRFVSATHDHFTNLAVITVAALAGVVCCGLIVLRRKDINFVLGYAR